MPNKGSNNHSQKPIFCSFCGRLRQEVDKLIEDPLEAKTFFNENHVCNRYTIPQPNLIIPSDSSQNSKASSIDVINNR